MIFKYSKNVTNLFSFKDCGKNFEFYWNILRKVHTTILFFPVGWNKVINVCNASSFQFIIMAQKYIFNCQKHEFSLKSTNWRSQCQNNYLKHFLLSPWSQSTWQYTCSISIDSSLNFDCQHVCKPWPTVTWSYRSPYSGSDLRGKNWIGGHRGLGDWPLGRGSKT